MVDRLLDPSTFANLPATYAEHRNTMARFLEANGLEHKLAGADELALSAAMICAHLRRRHRHASGVI